MMTKTYSKDRILATARALFFEKGFDAVSTDILARQAQVSKATIYRHFANMSDILEQIVLSEAAKFVTDLPHTVQSQAELDRILTNFGNALLGFLSRDDSLDFSRLIHEEARKNPKLGQTFYTAAVGRVSNDLRLLFANAQRNGIFKSDDAAADIAEDFIALLQGFGVIRVQLHVHDNAFPDIPAQVSRAVRTVMAAHGV